MASNRSLRFFWFVAALVVAFLLWRVIRAPKDGEGNPRPTPAPTAVEVATLTPQPPAPTPTCVPLSTTPGVQRVLVGPGACDVKPECITIQAGRDTVQWNTTGVPQGKDLWIEFDQQIFSGMTSSNGGKSYRVACAGQQCLSGAVNSTIPTPPARLKEYKYSQTLHDSGTNQACDGRIIIKW
jgi:hypothetical protein